MKTKWSIGLVLVAVSAIFFFNFQMQQKEKLTVAQPVNWPEARVVFRGSTDDWQGEYEMLPVKSEDGTVVSCYGRLYLTALNGIADDISAITYTFAPNSPYTLKGLLREFPSAPGQRWLATETLYTAASAASIPDAEAELYCQLVLQKDGAPRILIQIPLVRQ